MNKSHEFTVGPNSTTETPDYIYFVIRELDIFIGIVYLLFGLFGIFSNGKLFFIVIDLRPCFLIEFVPMSIAS